MTTDKKSLIKPLLRGHFHQASFFLALGAVAMLVARSHGLRAIIATIIYGLSLIGLFGISALYHRPKWSEKARMWMRRLDHSAIFFLIAGTGTPIFLLGMNPDDGLKLLAIVWAAATIGVFQALFWIGAPKWLSAVLYVGVGWLVFPYLEEIKSVIGNGSAMLILAGGMVYTLGAVVYALKRPDPYPKIFGYHEIFHLLVIIAALLHFIVIVGLVT